MTRAAQLLLCIFVLGSAKGRGEVCEVRTSGESCATSGSSVLQRQSQLQRESRHIDDSLDDRIAVVNNFAHLQNLDWLRGLRVEEVGFESPREVGESRPWLQWIVEHYDSLPEVVIFLHGHQSTWHHQEPVSVDYLKTHTPTDVTMLADPSCVWMDGLASRHATEMPGLNAVYQGIWDMDFSTAFSKFDMAYRNRCCSENMATKQAIKRFSKPVYQELINLIDENPTHPWGWIWERSWQNMWQKPTMKTDDRIIATLKAQSSALIAAGPQHSYGGLGLLQMDMRAATACNPLT